jgi:hypothetical protein
MKVCVTINTCHDCRHLDHSGSFTVRGARQICSHRDACQERTTAEKFHAEYPEYKSRDLTHFKYHWIHRVLTGSREEEIAEIPNWCPLKRGSRY